MLHEDETPMISRHYRFFTRSRCLGHSLLQLAILFFLVWVGEVRAGEVSHLQQATDPLVSALQKSLPPQAREFLREFDFLRCDHTGKEARLVFWASRQEYKDIFALYLFRQEEGVWRLAMSRIVSQYEADSSKEADYAKPDPFRLPGEPFHPLEGPGKDIDIIYDLIRDDREYNRVSDESSAYDLFQDAIAEYPRAQFETNALSRLSHAADAYFDEAVSGLGEVSGLEKHLEDAESELERTIDILEQRKALQRRIELRAAELGDLEEDLERNDPAAFQVYKNWVKGKTKEAPLDFTRSPLFQVATEVEGLRSELVKLPPMDDYAFEQNWFAAESARSALVWARMRTSEYEKLSILALVLRPRTLKQSMEMRGCFFQAREALEGEIDKARRLVEFYSEKVNMPPSVASFAGLEWSKGLEAHYERERSRYQRHLDWLRVMTNRLDYEMQRLMGEIEDPPYGFGKVLARP